MNLFVNAHLFLINEGEKEIFIDKSEIRDFRFLRLLDFLDVDEN